MIDVVAAALPDIKQDGYSFAGPVSIPALCRLSALRSR
jgi:hypothetical protein